MAANFGDAFYPVASYFAEPIDGGNIGVELRWAENEADFRAGKHKTARLSLAPDAADDLGAELRRQAVAVRRGQPN
jgi:hypothetical protein